MGQPRQTAALFTDTLMTASAKEISEKAKKDSKKNSQRHYEPTLCLFYRIDRIFDLVKVHGVRLRYDYQGKQLQLCMTGQYDLTLELERGSRV